MVSPRDKGVSAVRLKRLGLSLRAARGRAGLSQEEAGVRLGFSGKGQQGYRRWEAGEVDVPVSRLLEAADLFGVTPAFLFPESGPPSMSARIVTEFVEAEAHPFDDEEARFTLAFRAAAPAIRQAIWTILDRA